MLKRIGDVIVAQHRHVLGLMDEVEALPRAKGPIDELVAALGCHLRVEEDILHPYALIDDHSIIEFALRHLQGARGTREVRSRLRALRHLVVHHFEAEERATLPRLEANLDARTSGSMAGAAFTMFERRREKPDEKR